MSCILKARIKKGEYADVLVDEDIFVSIGKRKLYINQKGNPAFDNTNHSLRRFVLGFSEKERVFSINGNKLDCRRENLVAQNKKRFDLEKYLLKVDREHTDCWIWTGHRSTAGYASIKLNGVDQIGHRLFYKHLKGYLDETLVLDHLCRNPQCVNPNHLEQVSSKENTHRGLMVNPAVRGIVYVK